MKRFLKRAVLAAAILAAGCGVYAYATRPEEPLMEYHVTVRPGDTVWSICARIATDADDLSEVVWRAMHDSHITRAGDLMPGQLVVVKVKPVA